MQVLDEGVGMVLVGRFVEEESPWQVGYVKIAFCEQGWHDIPSHESTTGDYAGSIDSCGVWEGRETDRDSGKRKTDRVDHINESIQTV